MILFEPYWVKYIIENNFAWFFFCYFFSVATKNVLNYVAPILFLSHRVALRFYFLYSQYPGSSSKYIALVIVHFGSMQQNPLWIF